MSAVRGFCDPAVLTEQAGGARHPVFDQFGYRPAKGADPAAYLQPFRLVSDPPLFALIGWLKLKNGPHAEFWIANGMAKHLGWSERQLPPVRSRRYNRWTGR